MTHFILGFILGFLTLPSAIITIVFCTKKGRGLVATLKPTVKILMQKKQIRSKRRVI